MAQTRTNDSVAGPLFLVGMPRSGTKLLREMLNEHPRIRFSDIETEFLPYWVLHWPQLMPTGSPDQFRRFYADCLNLPFFIQNAEKGIHIDCDEWLNACASLTPAAVFEGLMRCCLAIPWTDRSIIWGDKSPSYIGHLPLIIAQFPDARIIHIIRDVRDYSLSIRNAWGKSILRAAQRWQDDVSRAREDGRKNSTRYIEVRYEDLLAETKPTLEAICKLIGIEFDARMLNPSRAVENLGATRNMRTVVRNNAGKYLTQMSPKIVAEIERIAGPTLQAMNYRCDYQGAPVRLPYWRLRILQFLDGLNLLRAGAGQFGLVRSVKYNLARFRMSGNRKY